MSITTIIFIIFLVITVVRKISAMKNTVSEVPPIVQTPTTVFNEPQVHQREIKKVQHKTMANTMAPSSYTQTRVPFEQIHATDEIATPESKNVTEEDAFSLTHDDLRKAIIYAEIIPRKY